MHLELVPISSDEKEILRNLLEKYDYEFSQYDNRDVNALGLFGYDYLDNYWTESSRHPFFIKADGKLAGFVLINDHTDIFPEAKFSIAEFFVLYKYRRCGAGSFAAKTVFHLFPGIWELKCHPKNAASVVFWDRVIRANTKDITCIENCTDVLYEDGTPARVYRFITEN